MGKKKPTVKVHKQINTFVMGILKSGDIKGTLVSCFDCSTPHCCRNRKSVDISPFDKKIISPLIKDAHRENAKKAIFQRSIGQNYTCPFLGENGLCDVYEHRPLACSSYAVASSPDGCEDPEGMSEIISPYAVLSRVPREMLATHLSEDPPADLLDLFL